MNHTGIRNTICEQRCGQCQISVIHRQINNLPMNMFFGNVYCLILSILDCPSQFDKQQPGHSQAIAIGTLNVPDLSTITISCRGLLNIVYTSIRFSTLSDVQTPDAIKNRIVLELLRSVSLYIRNNHALVDDDDIRILMNSLLDIDLIEFNYENIPIVLNILRQIQSHKLVF